MNDLNIKRPKDMPELQRVVIKMMFDDSKDTPNDGRWRNYEKQITYKNENYVIKAQFQCDGFFFTYRNLKVERPQSEIFLGKH